MELRDYITEAISSGKHRMTEYPEAFNVTSIVEWLQGLGVDKVYHYHEDGIGEDPPVKMGETVCYIGMCKGHSGTFWVAVYNNTKNKSTDDWTQEAIVWTKDVDIDKCGRLTSYPDDYKEEDMDAKSILDIMREMIENPRKLAKK